METTTYPTPGTLDLEVELPAGTIDVSSSDTDQTVLTIDGARDPDDFRIRFDPGAGNEHRLHVEFRGRKLGFGKRGIRVEVQVPLACAIDAGTGSGDLHVRGPVTSIAFRSGSGDIRFDEVEGDLDIKAAAGDVEGGRVGGRMSAHLASGDVRVGQIGAGLTVRTASGDLEARLVDGPVNVITVSGDVRLDSLARGDASVRTVSGDVTLGVAADTRVYLDLVTRSGDASSALDPGEAGGTEVDLSIRASSVSGDIAVRRAERREVPKA